MNDPIKPRSRKLFSGYVLVGWNVQHMRGGGLGLGGPLRRGEDVAAVLRRDDPGGVSLHVQVVLCPHTQVALQRMSRFRQSSCGC